jgi:poly(3-hydroxybutyrate) depolymerase
MMAHAAIGQTYDATQPPGNNFDQAQFRLWVPEGLQSVRAILVLVPGSNGDGRDQVDTPLWQSLAEEQGLALIGLYMTDKMHEDMFIEHYVDVSNGSGDAFLQAIDQLGEMSGHPEVGRAPLLLWGMSAGGEFNYEFALWRPDRVAGFVVNKGGIYYSALATRAARNVPGLFFVGGEDMAFRNDIIRGIFSINRRAHALWSLVEQAGVGHQVAGSDIIAAAFYRDVLKKRLSDSASLKPLNVEDGFFCDPASGSCVPVIEADTPGEPVSWLPTARMAAVWQENWSSTPESE